MSRAVVTATLVAVLLGGCGHSTVGKLRFENRAPVTKVNDRRDVPKKPAERPFPEKLYFFDAVFFDRIDNYMAFDEPRRAMNVNSLGEVPDSTWFTNRIGVRDLTLDEIRSGPNEHMEPDLPDGLIVKSSKVGGGSAGFIIEDARGDRYIIKFDESYAPVTESATDVAVQRLLWACGYNVPENSIIYFKREDVHLDDEATVKDVFGNKRKMTEKDVEKQLARSYVAPDGTYRALASKFLPGIPIGGYAQEGTREDDPNDDIPHQHRRDVRGLYIIFGWVQQTDAKEDNTLDIWIEGTDKRHYVRHYLVDFGKSFGTSALVVKRPGDGHVENLDFEFIFKSALTFGLWKRPYEGTHTPFIQGLGMFDAEHFEPGAWKSHAPYRAFDFADEYDMYWGAKIIIRFTEAQIRVAIEQGKFEDERGVDYLVETMVARQKKSARFAFKQVNPLDNFTVRREGDRTDLCFDDLLVKYELEPGAGAVSRYTATAYDYDANKTGWKGEAQTAESHTGCFEGIEAASGDEGYTIVRLVTKRVKKRLKPVEVHLAKDPADGQLRVIGINRR